MLARKLKIQPNQQLLTINAPVDFKKKLGPLPAGVKILTSGKTFDQVHWFVMNKKQMEKELPAFLKLVRDGVVYWVYYPKGSSKMQTDLTRDKGWDKLSERDDLKWISFISFDEVWSTFAFRKKTEADRKQEAKPAKEREIFKYVDPQKKTILVPPDLAALLRQNNKAEEYFNSLAFSHKKEYIEWIITAKKDETRQKRLEGTLERLNKSWKNPRNL